MPIYEFYCENCNTIYNFFSKTANTEKIPDCPHCKTVKLRRQMSLFSAVFGSGGNSDEDCININESQMSRAMEMMNKGSHKVYGQDPRQAAEFMEQFTAASGLKMGAAMAESIQRIQQGEDPRLVREDIGDAMTEEPPYVEAASSLRKTVTTAKPKVDETLYDL